MKTLTIEQTWKEINAIQKEVAEITRKAKFTQQDKYTDNKAALDELSKIWGAQVKPAYDRTTPRKADITSAYEVAQKVLKATRILLG